MVAIVAVSATACSGSGGGSPDRQASPEAFCDAVTNVELSANGYHGLAEVTPAPINADVERFAGFLAEIEAAGGPDGAERQQAITSDPEYQETLQRIGNYVTDECGIDGEGDTATDPEAPEGSSTTAPAGDERNDSTTSTPVTAGGGEGQGTPTEPRREEPAVAPDQVKAEMRAIFGDRLWGTSHGYFAPDGSEYEGNVRDLTEAEALSACEDLSAFIAEHPEMEGQGILRLTDITVNDDNEVVTNPIAVNDTIGAGDPGTCRKA